MHAKSLLHGFFIVLFSLISLGHAAFAEEDPPTPTTLQGGKIITADEAKALGGKASFFDMRKALSYGKGHLPGATALPYDQKSAKAANFDAAADKFDMAQLPADKAATIVFYSDGPTGWKSYKAAVVAIKNGYKNVMWLRGGTAEWESKKFAYEQ